MLLCQCSRIFNLWIQNFNSHQYCFLHWTSHVFVICQSHPFFICHSEWSHQKQNSESFFFFFVMKQWNSIKHMLKSLLWTYIFSFIFSPQILLATVRALFTSITHLLHEHVKVFWEWFFSLCSHNDSKHNLFLFVWASDHQCSLSLSFYVITEMMHRCQRDFAVTTIFVFPLVFYFFFLFFGWVAVMLSRQREVSAE